MNFGCWAKFKTAKQSQMKTSPDKTHALHSIRFWVFLSNNVQNDL